MRLRQLSPPKLLSLLVLLILFLLFRYAGYGDSSKTVPTNPVIPTTINAPTLVVSVSQMPVPSEPVLAASSSGVYYPVVKVVDGDTITVLLGSKKETLRLIGINTPETVDPRRPVECFGKEASDYAKGRLMNTSVMLTNDPTQADRDRYGRLLRYVYLPDGSFINQEMIEKGYAYEYTYSTPYLYQTAFKQAQTQAQQLKKGLWGETSCSNATL